MSAEKINGDVRPPVYYMPVAPLNELPIDPQSKMALPTPGKSAEHQYQPIFLLQLPETHKPDAGANNNLGRDQKITILLVGLIAVGKIFLVGAAITGAIATIHIAVPLTLLCIGSVIVISLVTLTTFLCIKDSGKPFEEGAKFANVSSGDWLTSTTATDLRTKSNNIVIANGI